MIFQGSSQIVQGVADVDPVAAPATIEIAHVIRPKDEPAVVSRLMLALIGTGVETVTLDLYFDIADQGAIGQTFARADKRWFQFATAQVITNGTLLEITSGLPNGGTIYTRRTADTIAASQTRNLMMAWVP